MYLLFPGRHHLLTKFQFDYLQDLLAAPLSRATDIHGQPAGDDTQIDAIIVAVTSSNHSNTRRNPLPFYIRALALEAFCKNLSVAAYIYGIDDVGQVSNFSSYTLKRIKHESDGMFDLTPLNTVVVCSTPVLEMYETAGFTILPAELTLREGWKYKTLLPWDIVEMIAADPAWTQNQTILEHMHAASVDSWVKYKADKKVQLLFRDKMISDDGDITTTRDYNTYVRQMDEIALLKYNDTAPFVRPGRIGDIGCAVGSWIKLACLDHRFRESDFYGIEVARQLFDICQQRKHNGEFKNPFVFFSQRNAVTGLVFDSNSMNTIHTSSLTHEIESYGSREELLMFMKNRFDELAPGGIWINRDVIGPAQKEQLVLMKLNDTDGRNHDYEQQQENQAALAEYLRGLSTAARFLRFKQDFRKKEGYSLQATPITRNGESYWQLSLRDACEFMSRKDYVDNWESEMHETFCFWDFDEWISELISIGFNVLPASHAYTNDWIVEHRLKDRVQLFEDSLQGPIARPYPVTNMLMVAEKR